MDANLTNGAGTRPLANTSSAKAMPPNQVPELSVGALEPDKVPSDVCGAVPCSHSSQAGTGGTSLPESAEGWAKLMKLALRAKKNTIIGIGRLFHVAKIVLDRGEWSRVWELPKSERPPLSKRHGDRYASIGQEFGDANETWPSHLADQLPASVEALGYLAQIGRQLVLELIVDGTIHEGLTANKARELRNIYRPDLNKERPFCVDGWIGRLHKLMDMLEGKGTPQDLAAAVAALEKALARLRRKVNHEIHQTHEMEKAPDTDCTNGHEF